MISLADRHHWTLEQAQQLSISEINEWTAYYQILSEKDG